MPLYRGFKKGPSSPAPPADPTRRIARPESAHRPVRARPTPAAQPLAPDSVTTAREVLPGLVVAWLAIIAGPGRGQVLALGYGVNDIGRGADMRIRLDFGDAAIASENQATIVYTTTSRQFYLQSPVAETRLNGDLVQESVELKGGETLQMGETCLRFVPLCGVDFDWGQATGNGEDPDPCPLTSLHGVDFDWGADH